MRDIFFCHFGSWRFQLQPQAEARLGIQELSGDLDCRVRGNDA
jgi:hypothetical protein